TSTGSAGADIVSRSPAKKVRFGRSAKTRLACASSTYERVGPDGAKAGFYGLDIYSLYSSIGEVLRYLDRVDPDVARLARHRYACLTPFQSDPAMYGLAAITDRYRSCEEGVVAMLHDLVERRGETVVHDGHAVLDVEQNARVAANAERYYRAMYLGGA